MTISPSSDAAGTLPTDDIARQFAQICLDAAVPIMEVYASDFAPMAKADKSLVTEADTRAELVICAALEQVLPGVPILAEERFSGGERPDLGDVFLLVDPLDGTKEFCARRDEFTVNIALVCDGAPVAGCVYAPAMARIYLGGGSGLAGDAAPGGRLEDVALAPLKTRARPDSDRIAMMSRSHADPETAAFAQTHGVTEALSAGSSLKFCRVAEGAADLYPRFGPTMEWDIGAGHAVLNAAGGCVTQPDGMAMAYNKVGDGYRNGPFVAWSTAQAW